MTVDRNRLIVPLAAPIYDALWNAAYPIVRVTTGLFLIPHGAQKLFGAFGGAGFEATAAGFAKMGLEPGTLMAALAGGTEFFGGLLLVLGLFTRQAAFICSGEMAFAYFISHAPRNFYPALNGGNLAIAYSFVFLYLAVAGGGAWSLDRWRSNRGAEPPPT